ncbi:hypothetical protein [Rosenbergiella epipactidis]|nr:hypothetical protein [Rosenbergiella epipactidis]
MKTLIKIVSVLALTASLSGCILPPWGGPGGGGPGGPHFGYSQSR